MSHATPAPVALTLPNMTINGYTGTLTLTGSTGADLVKILRDMQAAGMEQTAAVPTPTAPAPAPDSPPLCPIHHRAMKPSRKPGGWYCSAKVGDGYCSEKR